MSYIDSIKERIKGFERKNPDDISADKIKNDPKYEKVLQKLEELYVARSQITAQLEKCELDIDACILLLAMSEKKEEIDKRKI